jgi:transcriptional regulator with XRE-family HTH domain
MLRTRLIEVREKAGLSVREAAARLGKSPGYISRIEGRGEIPTAELICDMAGVYGCNPEPLLKLAAKAQIAHAKLQIQAKQSEALRLFRRSKGQR